jgi:hypothetical protein
MHALAFAGVFLVAERDSVRYVESVGGKVVCEKGHVIKADLSDAKFKVSDDVLHRLNGLVYLRELDMHHCKVRKLDKLPAFPRLKFLYLEYTDVDDYGVGVIVGRYRNLKSLDLGNTKVTYATFPLLMTHPVLEDLCLMGNYPKEVRPAANKAAVERRKRMGGNFSWRF